MVARIRGQQDEDPKQIWPYIDQSQLEHVDKIGNKSCWANAYKYIHWSQAAVQQHFGTITRDPQYLAELVATSRNKGTPAKYKYKHVPTKGVGDIYQNEVLAWLATTKHQLRALLYFGPRPGCPGSAW